MNKLIVIIIAFCMLISCKTSEEKTAKSIESESLSYDIKNPKLGKGYLSGMTKSEVYEHSKLLESQNKLYVLGDSSVISRFETDNFILTNHTVFYYYKGFLYKKDSFVLTDSVQFKSNIESDYKSEFFDNVTKVYGDNYHTNGTQNSKFYWTEKGVRVDLFDTLDKVFLSFTDIIVERTLESDRNRKDRDNTLNDKVEAF